MNDLHFGVVVGIDRYPGIEDLCYARSDAIAFHTWLTDPAQGAVPEDNTALITAPPDARFETAADARPTQRQVNDALLGFTRAATRVAAGGGWARTRLYLYVAGHGYAP